MALYLTYRPKDFASLVGQGFIKDTLQKAVEQDKTVWAYLFTWPRGTGKTSTARIFAKAVNCFFADKKFYLNDRTLYYKWYDEFKEILVNHKYDCTVFLSEILKFTPESEKFYPILKEVSDFFYQKYSDIRITRDNFFDFIHIDYFFHDKSLDINIKDLNSPCWKCTICQSFQQNRLIDIIEIDAASYTGVDNIREIIEKAQFQPTQTKYKIYIIDEVHMLSKGAFNALLKILEEPPKHVKFILATTEIQKVPETILSRCQRYDFRSITETDIRERLQYIAGEEGIAMDEKSYDYIVKHAEGGLRNAISLFEQLVQDKTISFEYISKTLWVGSEDEKQAFQKKLLAKDSSLLQDFEIFAEQGKNLKNFLKEILADILSAAQKDLQTGKPIQNFLEVLEALQEALMKTKNSFDETMTLKIWLLKILAGEKQQYTQPDNLLTKPHPNPLLKEREQAAREMQLLSPWGERIQKWGFAWAGIQEWGVVWEWSAQISDPLLSAVQDIFAPSPSFETPQKISSSQVSSGFDIEAFIGQVKTQGAKAAVTMSLRGSDISLQGDTLKINAKTSVSQNTLRNTDNQVFLLQAGDILGLGFQKIDIL